MDEAAVPSKVSLVIACDNEEYRSAIASVLALSSFIEIAAKSRQGEEGAAYVRRIDPDVVVLGVAPDKDCADHAAYYADCFDGHLICFPFNEEQAKAYRSHGFTRILTGSATREDAEAVIRKAVVSYRGSAA